MMTTDTKVVPVNAVSDMIRQAMKAQDMGPSALATKLNRSASWLFRVLNGTAQVRNPGTLDEFGDVFAALADPSRRLVLERLAAAGEGTATTLAGELPISRQAVVKHLAQLDRARLVHGHRQGREMRYSIRPDRLAATAEHLEAIAASWDSTLAILKQIAEESPQ